MQLDFEMKLKNILDFCFHQYKVEASENNLKHFRNERVYLLNLILQHIYTVTRLIEEEKYSWSRLLLSS